MPRTLLATTLLAASLLAAPPARAQQDAPTTPASPAPASGEAAAGPVELPLGRTGPGVASPERPGCYRFRADGPGVLTVVVRAASDADLVLLLTDVEGQPLPGARSDQDVGGARGAEQLAATLSCGGEYVALVESPRGEVSFQLGASWVPFPSLAREPDPDGAPSRAQQLTVGQKVEDTVHVGSGDPWDWFTIAVDEPGLLTVVTRAEGDLVLEVYGPAGFRRPAERSDQDLQGSKGNESLTLRVEPGRPIHLRVAGVSTALEPTPYRVSSGLIPE